MATIFERIDSGEIPSQKIHDDEHCFAIRDISPQAPVHVLVIPKRRIERIGAATSTDAGLLGHLLLVAARVAEQEGLENGYRVILNNGPDGGETVPHLHVHLLGGRAMAWPPG